MPTVIRSLPKFAVVTTRTLKKQAPERIVAQLATTMPDPVCELSFQKSISANRKGAMVMARKQNNSRLGKIRNYIQQNPDQKVGAVARNLGLDNKTVQRALIQCEDQGDLFSEDDNGRVRWFGNRK